MRFGLAVALQASFDFRQLPQRVDERGVVAAHRPLTLGNRLFQQGFAHLWATGEAVEAGEADVVASTLSWWAPSTFVGSPGLALDGLRVTGFGRLLRASRSRALRAAGSGCRTRLVERHETLRERERIRVFASFCSSVICRSRTAGLSCTPCAQVGGVHDAGNKRAYADKRAPGFCSHHALPRWQDASASVHRADDRTKAAIGSAKT